jgi:predicted dehydrogenase
MDKIKMAFSGAGAINQRRHLPEAVANGHVELVGLFDPNADRCRQVAEQFGVTSTYDSYEAMLEHSGASAVVVGTPNADHAPQSIKAAEAGKHVLVEKPMATTREEAKAMIAAADKAGTFLMVGQNQRLIPAHIKAREIVQSGKMGRVLAFETNFKHPGADGWSVDGASSWFFKKNRAVMGVNGDLGIHKCDLMRYILGEEITHIGGQIATLDKKTPDGQLIPVDDNAFLTVRTDKGTLGSIHISWTNYGRIEDNGTLLFCENGTVRVAMDKQFDVMVDMKNGQKERHMTGQIATNDKQVSSGIMDRFVESIRTNTKPEIDGHEGYRSLIPILTAVEAAEQGRTLEIEY